jgi:malonyl CoA-acyl carrier protein transacylase
MSLRIIMFPGQGSQSQGMGKDLFAEFPQAVQIASHTLGYDIAEMCLNNPDNRLNQTNVTQPALYFVNYLHYQKFLKENEPPDFFLGHSLGEFNALNAAGVFDFETGLRIVKKRGELMFSMKNGGMAAVLGADYDTLNGLLVNFPEIDIANINTATQLVISGMTEALDKAGDFLEEEGYSYVPLKVSGAFHSRYMSPVKKDFSKFIEGIKIEKPLIPVVANYTSEIYPVEHAGIVRNMVNQLDNPIMWRQSIDVLLKMGDGGFIEMGPGEVLSNLVKKIKAQR